MHETVLAISSVCPEQTFIYSENILTSQQGFRKTNETRKKKKKNHEILEMSKGKDVI